MTLNQKLLVLILIWLMLILLAPIRELVVTASVFWTITLIPWLSYRWQRYKYKRSIRRS